jgi:hypothetical protein
MNPKVESVTISGGIVSVTIGDDIVSTTWKFTSWDNADTFVQRLGLQVDAVEPPDEDDGPETPFIPPINEPAEEVLV